VQVQSGHGQVGERAAGVERQAPVAVEEQLVKAETGERAVRELAEQVVAEVEPAQVNEVDERTGVDLRYRAVAHVQVLQPGDEPPVHRRSSLHQRTSPPIRIRSIGTAARRHAPIAVGFGVVVVDSI